ncbi:MAG: hypothetical protein ABI834_10150 [Ginsengibacter sp.]
MVYGKKNLQCLLLTCILYLLPFALYAQTDTIPQKPSNKAIRSKPRLFNKMIKNFRRDTTEVQQANDLKRNDVFYKKFEGYTIRHVIIKDLHFGIPLADTSKKIVTTLTRLANKVHHITRSSVIRNNLFFSENDSLLPYLMADNETFLRQLPYLQDASIEVLPIIGSSDSVDINVIVKDLFSLGGSLGSIGLKNTDVEIREDNLSGYGNSISFRGLYDISRRKNFGGGFEYLQRNIGGSFIDGDVGYRSFYPNFNGLKEENIYYTRFIKPLVNRYMHWTYEFNASYHSTRNLYSSDSLYLSDIRYRFYNFDAWTGYNLRATKFTTSAEDRKLRKLIALRIIYQKFNDLPGKYFSLYNWRYANLTGVLGALTFYRQNFYKSQYIYAFGRNEDIPEGLNLTLTAGYTQKQNITRPFIGFNYQRSSFNLKKNYFSYTVRAEGYLHNKNFEDINLLAAIDYFDHLKAIGTKWKQRTFINIGIAKQINTLLNEPLYLDSKFALPEYRNGDIGGSLRATIKAESVFFSPWSIASFRFAPFIFGNTGLFSPYNTGLSTSNIYSTVGAGIRTRNESLIFGTFELRGYYFLKENIRNQSFRFDISTNIAFKYNAQLVRRPDFIEVN